MWVEDQPVVRSLIKRPMTWIMAGAVALVLVIATAIGVKFLGKRDFTEVTTSMLIRYDKFPSTPGIRFGSAMVEEVNQDPINFHVDPPVCEMIVYGPRSNQDASFGTMPLTQTTLGRAYSVNLRVASERPNLADTLQQCSRYTNGSDEVHTTSPLPSGSLKTPGSVIYRSGTGAIEALGYVRGVFIRAVVVGSTLTDQDIETVTALFNAQAERLEAL